MASDLRLKEQLPNLTDKIVATYHDIGTINHLGHCPLPRYDVVIDCIADLKEILYPGYRRREKLHVGNVTYHVGDLIDSLHDKLTTQIASVASTLHPRPATGEIQPAIRLFGRRAVRSLS